LRINLHIDTETKDMDPGERVRLAAVLVALLGSGPPAAAGPTPRQDIEAAPAAEASPAAAPPAAPAAEASPAAAPPAAPALEKKSHKKKEPAPPKPRTADLADVQKAATAWMHAVGAARKIDTSKGFPPELRAEASQMVESVVGSVMKTLADIPADKMVAVVEAFEAATTTAAA